MTVPSGLSYDKLAEALRRGALRNWSEEAAVEILIGQQRWLRRPDFAKFIDYHPADPTCPHEFFTQEDCAFIEWRRLSRQVKKLPATDNERRLLECVLSIAGVTKVDLSELSGIDEPSIGLLLNAIARVSGWHDRGHSAKITGRFVPFIRPDPTFEEVRINARNCLSSARDWMHSDLAAGEQLSDAQDEAVSRFWDLLGKAKAALDAAAR